MGFDILIVNLDVDGCHQSVAVGVGGQPSREQNIELTRYPVPPLDWLRQHLPHHNARNLAKYYPSALFI